jgi:hypothetical protein
MTEQPKNPGRSLLEFIRAHKLDSYGSVILAESVHAVLGLEFPETATKRVFDQLALQELAAVDYVRNALLNEGKYLTQRDGDYRILLPSENARQIELYMNSADKKLRRAQRLSKHTPRIESQPRDNTAERIHLKREAIKNQVVHGNCKAA